MVDLLPKVQNQVKNEDQSLLCEQAIWMFEIRIQNLVLKIY